ncbi:DUF3299 domain-containing protein [Microbulbifer rhizosphaerae]|uniref:DUF3299 domain-containing protein n=1 Tax=Microbulbifer rhizosphaerae TaxID=1562603 RepID=UPI001622809D
MHSSDTSSFFLVPYFGACLHLRHRHRTRSSTPAFPRGCRWSFCLRSACRAGARRSQGGGPPACGAGAFSVP